jgi:PAS domain S-box-containing protein
MWLKYNFIFVLPKLKNLPFQIDSAEKVTLNRILLDQLRHHVGYENIPEKFIPLFKSISNSYDLLEDKKKSQQASENLNILFENLDEVFFSVDMVNYKIIQMSGACEKVYGFTPKEFINNGNLWLDRIYQADKHVAYTQLDDLKAGKKVHNQYRITDKSNNIRWLANKVIPTLDDNGVLVRLDGISTDITEKITNIQKLEQNEAQLNSIINNTSDTIFAIDRSYKLIFANDACIRSTYELTGHMRTPGEPFFIKNAGAVLNRRWKQNLDRALLGEEFKVEENYTIKGIHYSVEISFNPIKEKEIVRGVGCFVRDVTRQKRYETRLRASEEKFRSLIENGLDMIALVDADGKLAYTSPSIERTFGYSVDELSAANMSDILFGNDIIHAVKVLNKIKKEPGKQITFVTKSTTKNNKHIWLEGSMTNMLNVPDVDAIIVNFRDITHQRENELRIIESEKKYRNLFENNPMPMWVVDTETLNLLDANSAAMKHYGYSKEEFMTMRFPDLMVQAERVKGIMFENHREKGFNNTGVWQHVKKDGSILITETYADAIEFEGKPASIVLANDITKRVKAEEKHERMNERYRLATKATNDAIWDWNLKTNEIYWSEGYNKLFGHDLTRDEIYLHSWLKNIHPDDFERVVTGIHKAINDGRRDFWEDEYRYFKSDGSMAYVSDRGYILYDENETPVRMVGAMQDITRRRKVEEHLYKSEANLRNIFENTHIAYVLLDENSKVLSFNSVAFDLSLKTLSEALREDVSYFDLMPEHRKEDVKKAIEKVISIGKTITYEAEYTDENLNPIWLLITMHPIFDRNKKTLGLSIAANNITEQKLAEQMLRKSEANLRTVFDGTEGIYFLLDKKFNLLSFNHKAAIVYKEEHKINLIEGLNMIDILPVEKKEAILQKFLSVLQGEKISYETNFSHKDGSESWHNVSALPVVYSENKVAGIIISVDDITQRKNIELEKEKITLDLIHRNKDLEQFAYIISHNLRSPVANITGLSNMILNNSDLDKRDQQKCLEGLALSVKKLDDVIIDLNYILQVRREINEKKEIVKFSEIVNDIKTSINNLIQKEEVVVFTDFSAVNELSTLKSYLNSIFYNLISNSIKYRDPLRKPRINITSRLLENKIEIAFSDNGLGIDIDTNGNKIFGLYKKFHSHTDGKGMGLFMVKTQVEILGGKISIASEVGKGTTFTIELDA